MLNVRLRDGRTVRKALLYLLPVGIPLGLSLVTVPVVIHAAGASSWGSIAVGQSVGNLASIAVGFGWGVVGPTRVARMDGEGRRVYFKQSVVARGLLAVPCSAATIVIIAVLTNRAVTAAELAGMANCLGGLGAQWYFVGEARPGRLILFDTLPRSLGTVGGLAALLAGAEISSYAGAQLVGSIVAAALSTRLVLGAGSGLLRVSTMQPAGLSLRSTEFRAQFSAFGTAATAAAYTSFPLLIVSAIAPRFTPVYAMADKLSKIVIAALGVGTQILQGWVPRLQEAFVVRARAAITIALGSGLIWCIATTFGMPLASRFLSHGAIRVPLALSFAFGIVSWLICVSQCLGLVVLATAGRIHIVTVSTIAGAILAIPLLIILSGHYGGLGAAWGVVIAEASVLAIQSYAIVPIISRSAPALMRQG